MRILRTTLRLLLVALLAAAGLGHLFWGRRGYRIVVPPWAEKATGLDKDAIIVASGAVELGLAGALVALPRERARIGWVTAAFFAAVFPGNIHQWQSKRSAPFLRTDRARGIRLLLQPVLIAWAIFATRPEPVRRRRR